jgi:hypothetical protein
MGIIATVMIVVIAAVLVGWIGQAGREPVDAASLVIVVLAIVKREVNARQDHRGGGIEPDHAGGSSAPSRDPKAWSCHARPSYTHYERDVMACPRSADSLLDDDSAPHRHRLVRTAEVRLRSDRREFEFERLTGRELPVE